MKTQDEFGLFDWFKNLFSTEKKHDRTWLEGAVTSERKTRRLEQRALVISNYTGDALAIMYRQASQINDQAQW